MKNCNLIIYDTAGEETELTEMDEELYRKTDGAVLVVAVEYELSSLLPLINAYRRVKDSDDVPIVLVISKCDLPAEKWKFTDEDIEKFMKDNNISEHVHTSAKENGQIDAPFSKLIELIKLQNQKQATKSIAEPATMPATKPAKRVKKKWFCF
ncbi:MAG: small G-protein ras1 [Marteilia pararefringens]